MINQSVLLILLIENLSYKSYPEFNDIGIGGTEIVVGIYICIVVIAVNVSANVAILLVFLLVLVVVFDFW